MQRLTFRSAVLNSSSRFACWSLILTLVVVQSRLAAAGLIPDNRITTWTPGSWTGVPGGIPNRTAQIDVTQPPYNADSTGVKEVSGAIQAAINAAPSNSVVYLPAGTYFLSNQLNIAKSISIRGAGSNTLVKMGGAADFAYVGTASDYLWRAPGSNLYISSSMMKGVTNLVVPSTNGFIVGHIAQIVWTNDLSLPVISPEGYEEMRKQKTLITGLRANSVDIWPPLYGDYSATPGHITCCSLQAYMAGIENLTIDAGNTTGAAIIYFEQCFACWVKNVHVKNSANCHVSVADSLQCEVRDSFLDTLQHVGSNGAGINMGASSGCLIENNIIYNGFPLVEVNNGCSGNVFGYNFVELAVSYGIMGAALDGNHDAHNSFNLYEGNVMENYYCDGYHGSTSHDTLFRNYIHGTSPDGTTQNRVCVKLDRFTRDYNVVGNIIGTTNIVWVMYTNGLGGYNYTQNIIFTFGLPNMGNGGYTGYGPPWANLTNSPPAGPDGFQEFDTNVWNTTILIGNYNYYTNGIPASESLGSNTLPASMYLTNQPSWFGTQMWPPFDPTSPNPSKTAIPAGSRYYSLTIPTTPPLAPVLQPLIGPTPSQN